MVLQRSIALTVSQHYIRRCMCTAESVISKAGHGRSKNYGTNRGKIYIPCGGSAVRNAIDWQQKNTN